MEKMMNGGEGGGLLCSVAEDVVLAALHFVKVKLGARHASVDVFDVVAGRLEVSGGVVRARDEDLEKEIVKKVLKQFIQKSMCSPKNKTKK